MKFTFENSIYKNPYSICSTREMPKILTLITTHSKQFIFTVKSCQDQGTPRGGSKKGNIQVGQTLYFSCDHCYQLRGSATRTCKSDLSWSGRQPTCTGKLHGFRFAFLILIFWFSPTFHFSAEWLSYNELICELTWIITVYRCNILSKNF